MITYTPPRTNHAVNKYTTEYLEKVATEVRDHLLKTEFKPYGVPKDTDSFDVNPLYGFCFQNARDLSNALYQADVKHRIVKGAIGPFLEQYEFDRPFTEEHTSSVGGMHYWVEVDHPEHDLPWVMEICSEHRGEHYQRVYVEKGTHQDISYLENPDTRNRKPWRDTSEWYWNPNDIQEPD